MKGQRRVFDLILSDGTEEWQQAWGLVSFERAAEFSRSLGPLSGNYTREIRDRWETV